MITKFEIFEGVYPDKRINLHFRSPDDLIWAICKTGDYIGMIRSTLDDKPELLNATSTDDDGIIWTPLKLAVYIDRLDYVKELVNRGAHITEDIIGISKGDILEWLLLSPEERDAEKFGL